MLSVIYKCNGKTETTALLVFAYSMLRLLGQILHNNKEKKHHKKGVKQNKGRTVSCCRTRSVKNLQQFSLLSSSPEARTSALSPTTMPSTSSSLKRSWISPGRKNAVTLSYWKWIPKATSNDVPNYDSKYIVCLVSQYQYKGFWFQPEANKSFIMTRKRSSGICASVSSRATRWFFTPVLRNSPARSVWGKPNPLLNDAHCGNGPHEYGQLSFTLNLLSIAAVRLRVLWWCISNNHNGEVCRINQTLKYFSVVLNSIWQFPVSQ